MTQSQNKFKFSSKDMALTALLTSLAIIFTYIETLIPIPLPIPGIKLGLANIIIVISLYRQGFLNALFINLARILLVSLIYAGFFAALYSLSGAILSLATMWILKKCNCFSIIGISMAGAFMHNLGQLLMAALVLTDFKVLTYMPVLTFTGIISGILMGFIAYLLNEKLPQTLK